MDNLELDRLAAACRRHLVLNAELPDEYFYGHLGCCAMDAVHSIGVKYESTFQVPIRYCQAYGIERLRPRGSGHPRKESQETISKMIERIEAVGSERFASTIVRNRHRTSAKNGILKAEAVLRFAKSLAGHGVETFQDLAGLGDARALEESIKSIPGQKSGISWLYFRMLAGDDHGVKPDRMILGFLVRFSGRAWRPDEAIETLRLLCAHRDIEESKITPRSLDFAIWNWQRDQGKAKQAKSKASTARRSSCGDATT